MKNKQGFFFSLDALVSMIIIILTLVVAFPIIKYSTYDTAMQGDVMNVLSTLQIGEINNTYVQGLISVGKITDLNKSVLEQIGDFYTSDPTSAKNLADSVLSGINTRENVGIWFCDESNNNCEMISSFNTTPYETSKSVEVDKQEISGIQKGKTAVGFMAKAWLKKINSKETSIVLRGDVMCGGWSSGWCGFDPANATYLLDIPADAVNITGEWYHEPVIFGENIQMFVNGNKVFDSVTGQFNKVNITGNLTIGTNKLFIIGSRGVEDGASHIDVKYKTSEMQTFSQKSIFPLFKLSGLTVLHEEKSIYIPSTIYNMNVVINTTNQTKLSILRGNTIALIGTKGSENGFVNFSDSEIKNNLSLFGISYSNLTDKYFTFLIDIGENTQQYAQLGDNSYVYINYSHYELPYGVIDITEPIKLVNFSNWVDPSYPSFYSNVSWEYYLPPGSKPFYTDYQFGWLEEGGRPWCSQFLKANGVDLYRFPGSEPFLEALTRMAYTPTTEPGVLTPGLNNFTADFCPKYGFGINISSGFVTYFINSFNSYEKVFSKAQGGIKIVKFKDGSTRSFNIGNISDGWDNSTDAVDDAVDRLLTQFTDIDGNVQLMLNQDDLEPQSIDISGVPNLWKTMVQIRRWH